MTASRRHLLKAGTALTLLPVLTPSVRAETLLERVADVVGNAPMRQENVTLTLPALAESGNSVALTVSVDSAMEAADHVRTIHIVAEKNPLPEVISFELTAALGAAEVSTRVRLADTQLVMAVAETSDGQRFFATAEVVVTEAACLDFLI